MKLKEIFFILYLHLRNGYWNCKSSFEIWGFLMTNDLERLHERCHGLNCFDEFYGCLDGHWGGDR